MDIHVRTDLRVILTRKPLVQKLNGALKKSKTGNHFGELTTCGQNREDDNEIGSEIAHVSNILDIFYSIKNKKILKRIIAYG